MTTCLRTLLFIAVTAVVPSSARSAEKASVGSAQIVERCGAFGALRIGSLAPADGKQMKPNLIALTDGTNLVVDRNRHIAEILVARRGVFTQRYVVIGQSTLKDVVDRYGQYADPLLKPESRTSVQYPYEGIAFELRQSTTKSPQTGTVSFTSGNLLVSGVVLKAQTRDPSGADHSCPIKK